MDEVTSTIINNHKRAIEDLQGRSHAHRALLLFICRHLLNEQERSELRQLTSWRAVAGVGGDPPQYYNEGWKQECRMIAERLAPEDNEENHRGKIAVEVEPS